MTPADLARELERKAQALRQAAQRVQDRGTKAILNRAKQNSSGPLSSAELRKRSHPYARRRPAPTEDPAVINAQTGAFREAWRREGNKVVNDDPKAAFMGGTAKMHARPVAERTAREVEPEVVGIVEEEVERALR